MEGGRDGGREITLMSCVRNASSVSILCAHLIHNLYLLLNIILLNIKGQHGCLGRHFSLSPSRPHPLYPCVLESGPFAPL